MSRHLSLLVALCSALLLGCDGGPAGPEDENVIAPDGKEDNYFSNTAQEFMATATVPIQLEDEYAQKTQQERDARARELMEGRTQQVGWFLHVFLIDKEDDEPAGNYGGVRAMVLDGSYESDALKADPENPLKYTFGFAVQVGGTKDLLAKVRAKKSIPAGQDTFPLDMAKLSNWQIVGFSHSGYGAGTWSPETCKCEIEKIDIKLQAIPPSNDAYLDYGKMLDDDVIDISVHVGWDYWARYDLTHSRELYSWLVDEMGFTSPAASYEKYSRISGPLTKKLSVNGRTVEARVTIFRPDPCESWDEDGPGGSWAAARAKDKNSQERSCPDWKWDDAKANANPTTDAGAGNLMSDLKASLKTRDAIIFTGHSGYTYGYALASWYRTSRGDLDPPEIKTLDLPKDKSQIFLFSGCETYHVAEAFRDNPNKLGLHNADVITTNSFSNAGSVETTQDLIRALVGDSKTAAYAASSWGKLLSKYNPQSTDWGYGFYTMYGVHGIDDNPLADPLGDASKSCKTCQTDGDCGALGNVCVRLNDTEKVCTQQCLQEKGCAADQVCRQFGSATSGYLKGLACVPRSLSCGVTPPPPPVAKQFTASGDVTRNQTKSFKVEVGTTAKEIKVAMTGTGDADLYTRFGSAPTLTQYDCRPYKSSSSETCSYTKASSGTLYLMVNGYAASSHFELKVTWK
jgi:hypothetical protein